jgi:chromosome segregation ATPase
MESQQTLTNIKLQLDERRHRETALEQEIKKLSDYKSRLKQIGIDYAATLSTIRSRKNTEIKCLNRAIDELKKQQGKVIQMKTGFFRGISDKERERKEMAIAAELDSKLNRLELVLLDYSAKRKQLRSEYDTKIEPELKQLKDYQKKTQEIETDASLEERWFACEALIDAVNSFLQRKATQPY